jgi:ribosomal protein L21
MSDIQTLDRKFKFRPLCLRNLRVTGTLLKKAAAAGLNLVEIGRILCRDDFVEGLSILEEIVEKARIITENIRKMQNNTRFMREAGHRRGSSLLSSPVK